MTIKSHTVFGIRHHGPGSARNLANALESMAPDIILIEGPPGGNALIKMAEYEEMEPPVALLIYNPKALGQAAFYPFAVFSPEWQAIQYGLKAGVPVMFIDLPIGYRWGGEARETAGGERRDGENDEQGTRIDEQGSEEAKVVRTKSPLARIAEQAGYPDGDSWWNEWVEKRIQGEGVFGLITELMGSLRGEDEQESEETYVREAYMRREIRRRQKDGFSNIAVVCGAFHAPVLQDMPSAKDDGDLLRGLKKVKTEACWIPWTYERLSYQSGYGAGVRSPAWYEMLFERPQEELIIYWLSSVSMAFREEGLDASPAHVIEAVRLSQTLAALRGQSIPGLDEMKEAVEAIFCHGEKAPMQVVERKLIVGQKMGRVPADAPQFPLQRDIIGQKKKFRLKDQTTQEKPLDLDLREERQLAKSYYLHRLRIIGVNYGEILEKGNKKGTFHEYWKLDWQPELELSIIHAAVWGNKLEEACLTHISLLLHTKISLPDLPGWLQKCLWAGLNAAIPPLVKALEEQVALDSDVSHLMDTLPPLVHILRYGDVRQTANEPLQRVIDGMMPRIIVGLAGSTVGLNDEFADKRSEQMLAINQIIPLIKTEDFLEDWLGVLLQVAGDSMSHPKLRGISSRILFDQEIWQITQAEQAMSQVLSSGVDSKEAAAWLEGFLHGSGLLLIHHPALWQVLNNWVAGLEEDIFVENLPLLRRTFSKFAAGEKRQLGELAKHGKRKIPGEIRLSEDRKALIMPILGEILGEARR